MKERSYLVTNEGPAAVKEAIKVLQKTEPCCALKFRNELARSAQDHVEDTGPKGVTGHTGTDGSSPFQRIERYVGGFLSGMSENISYGKSDALQVVM